MTMLGIGFFSAAITEEKEEDTLGLMLLAGVRPLGILLGKSVGRLVQALFLIAVQYPFTQLAVTMGGVMPNQVQATYAAFFAYMVMLAGMGLFCSTLARRSRTSAIWLLLMIVAYWIVPLCCNALLARSSGTWPLYDTILDWISTSCVFQRVGRIASTGFAGAVLSHQVITNFVIGGVGFAVSWAVFAIAVRDPSSEATTRGLVAHSGSSWRWLEPRSPLPNAAAVTWRDFHFLAGGKPAVLLRLLFYPSIFIAASLYQNGFLGGIAIFGTTKAITATYLNFILVALAIDAGFLVSRSLRDEIRGNTLGMLVLLPISIGQILYAKVRGSLQIWFTGFACLLVGIFALPYGLECCIDFFGFHAWHFYTAHLILIPHAAAVFAVFLRWGALPLGICSAIASLILTWSALVAMQVGVHSGVTQLIALGILAICGVCHLAVWRRAEALVAQGI